MSFHQICEAIENGDDELLTELDFDAAGGEGEDADFSDDFAGGEDIEGGEDLGDDEDADVEDDTAETVTVEVDPNGSLTDALHSLLDVLEGEGEGEDEDLGDDEVEDDTEDSELDGEELEDDDTEGEDAEVEDDTDEADADEFEEEDEEELDTSKDPKVHVADKMKQTERTKKTPSVNRKPTADDDLELAPAEEGDFADVLPLARTKKTPSVNRKSTADSRVKPTRRITNIGKGQRG